MDLQKILKKYFGYNEFRENQLEIINSVLEGNDTLAIMPTGGGKSLCYQIPAVIFEGITVVVSPLIALMEDQLSQLEAVGISTTVLNSTLDWDEYVLNMNLVASNSVKIVFCAPETLVTDRIKSLFSTANISCVTIDEAHCISEWGHDFRPEYRRIAEYKDLLPNATWLAMTATATETVRKDIKKCLKFGKNKKIVEFVSSFNRPNIFIDVVSKSGKTNKTYAGKKLSKADELTLDFVKSHSLESGIIYCYSRKNVDNLALLLQVAGMNALPYHAGLTDEERSFNQNAFVKDDVKIIVATLAFGMGINKPNVRYVIHYDLPKSIEQYYQEIGRAGRDGENATALLLYSYADTKKLEYFFTEKPAKEKKIAMEQLQKMADFASTTQCKRQFLLNHFGEQKKDTSPEECCVQCANRASLNTDTTIPAQKFLSAIVRTNQKFGATYITEVLLGARLEKILANGHDKLSVYGIGTEYSKSDWLQIAALLVDAGFVKKGDEYPILSVTEKGMEHLKNRKKFYLPFFPTTTESDFAKPAKSEKLAKTKSSSKDRTLANLSPKDQTLFESLRTMRKRLADESNVPPYVIFGDRTLYELVEQKPLSDFELENVYGFGQRKIEKYGEFVTKTIESAIRS